MTIIKNVRNSIAPYVPTLVIVLVLTLKHNIEAYDNSGKNNVLTEKLTDISSMVWHNIPVIKCVFEIPLGSVWQVDQFKTGSINYFPLTWPFFKPPHYIYLPVQVQIHVFKSSLASAWMMIYIS